MADSYKKQNECFEKDYETLYAKGAWAKDDVAMMKDYKKLIYYNLVIEAMENGNSYPGSEHMPEMSFARGRDSMGRFTSNDMMRGNGSGMYYPEHMNNGGMYYDSMGMSGRRYYDSEKEKAIHKLHHMMENEDNIEKKNALKLAITELEQK